MSLVDFLAADGDRLLLRATALVYLASRSVSISNVESPVRELRDNVIPAFEAFLRVGRVRPELPVIFISSGGAVYGRTEHNRTPESEPVKPISPYGLGKVLTEKCLIFCSDTVGQPYAILRASNAIGRWHRNRHQGLAMAALRAIRSGAPLDIYGDGNAVRDYIDADDLADAILAVAASGKSVKGIWNVGSGVGHSTLEVVETVASVAGRWPRVVFKPSRSVDVPRSVLDPTRFAQDFGWEMRVTFRNAIERLVQSAEAAW
jgi:UDP-glucose 4-epimerase